jgi:thiamine pyrophosphokinase
VKKIVIIANGERPDITFFKKHVKDANYVIAADGGIKICLANNITPDCLIGDLDSAGSIPENLSGKTKIIHVSEQNTTDMQKALIHAETLNPEIIEVFAAFGKRTDHSLGNIFILQGYVADTKLIMYDPFGYFTLLKPGVHEFNNKKGQTISLFSFSDISNIQLSGFEFPIDSQKLAAPFLGVSNKIIEDVASIQFDEGRLLVYVLNKNEI